MFVDGEFSQRRGVEGFTGVAHGLGQRSEFVEGKATDTGGHQPGGELVIGDGAGDGSGDEVADLVSGEGNVVAGFADDFHSVHRRIEHIEVARTVPRGAVRICDAHRRGGKHLMNEAMRWQSVTLRRISMAGSLTSTQVVLLVIVAILVVGALVYAYMRKRSVTLRQKFGPEYEHAVKEHGSARVAEAKLADREKRVSKLKIRELTAEEREGFLSRWLAVQSRFVDSPREALMDADALLSSVMSTRGYPVADFEQRAADVSVDHPRVVENYRTGHDIALQLGRGNASTEEMRKAMLHYRSLFDDLVTTPRQMKTKEVA